MRAANMIPVAFMSGVLIAGIWFTFPWSFIGGVVLTVFVAGIAYSEYRLAKRDARIRKAVVDRLESDNLNGRGNHGAG